MEHDRASRGHQSPSAVDRRQGAVGGPHAAATPTIHQTESGAPHGMIDLAHCMTVKSAELKAGKKNAIEVSTREKTYYMYADTEKVGNRYSVAVAV